MSLIICADCSNNVSDNAHTCPYCGASPVRVYRTPNQKKGMVIGMGGIIVGLCIALSTGAGNHVGVFVMIASFVTGIIIEKK